MNIKIISVPPGEAPFSIREEWVGLILPSVFPEAKLCRTFGVLSGPTTFIQSILALLLRRGNREKGYIVRGADAINILAQQNMEAATWWRNNTVFAQPNRFFLFPESVCEQL